MYIQGSERPEIPYFPISEYCITIQTKFIINIINIYIHWFIYDEEKLGRKKHWVKLFDLNFYLVSIRFDIWNFRLYKDLNLGMLELQKSKNMT